MVNDEEPVRRVIELALCDRHDVVVARSGNDAIRVLGEPGRFDAVLCDIMMGDGTGVNVYTWLSRQRPDLLPRLVFMSGGTSRPEPRAFMASVSNPWLEKPFTIAQLDELVEGAIAAGEPAARAEPDR